MDIECVLVLIHGIGNQPESWSQDFQSALQDKLQPGEWAKLALRSVYWADLSRLPGTPVSDAAAPEGPTVSATTRQAYIDYAQHLARQRPRSGTRPRPRSQRGAADAASAGATDDLGSLLSGVAKGIMNLKGGAVSVTDHITDVANYVAKNKIRLAVQERLVAALFEMQAAHPEAALLLGAHSQGTIIAYDVLRVLAARLPSLRVWVSMGCPLDWYLNGASWGDNELELPAAVRWTNLYDPADAVGQDLGHLAQWTPEAPEDVNVDNVGHHLDPHDHWHNPAVVDRYVGLIREFVTAP